AVAFVDAARRAEPDADEALAFDRLERLADDVRDLADDITDVERVEIALELREDLAFRIDACAHLVRAAEIDADRILHATPPARCLTKRKRGTFRPALFHRC